MPYQRQWSSAEPGCFIVLIDQSGSMGLEFRGTKLGAGRFSKKAEAVAMVFNNVLNEIVLAGTDGTQIKPRADIAVLGYGGHGVESALPNELASQDFVKLAELSENPLRFERITRKGSDDTGALFEYVDQVPVWVDAVAAGGTPMCAAFRRARDLAEQWAADNPDSFPPVVVNISDGAATDGDPILDAAALRQVSTADGTLLLFNCHITEIDSMEVTFPSGEAELPRNDPQATLLFQASSVIPDELRSEFAAATGSELVPGARGYIFNGDAASVRNMLKFGSAPATRPVSLTDDDM